MKRPRKLRVVRHKHAARCGANVIWCGPGSPWDNPWRARQHEPLVANAIHRAHIQFNDPPWTNAGGILHGPRRARPGEQALALASLYRIWVESRIGEMSAALRVAIAAALAGDDHAAPFPAPPTREAIRTALRGRTLADGGNRKHATHAFVLLDLANDPLKEAVAA